ncbi:ester cyclase [Achromobacter xylosoxidans]|uniref:ester cyclase n=1 Tax=Alcaligenes xylosoxydans xylosoxydans TaxID=85698 RepID=UPI000970BA93|nr:ester cyclase [Achromobacter xylosoxidans]MCV6902072.1 ester cyclase [Achromobacter xylosoxidans]
MMANAKALIEKLHDLWNTGDLSRIPEIYDAAFVAHMPKGWDRSEFIGYDGVRDAVSRIRSAFPDWHERVEDVIEGQGKVVTRYVSTGTHTGPFIGLAATGKRISIDEISIYHLADGRVVEQWCLTDDLSLARQLGCM